MLTDSQFPAYVVTFTEEILNGKLNILYGTNNYLFRLLVKQGPRQT